MKKYSKCLLFALIGIITFSVNVYGQKKDPVVMSIDGQNITKSEFLRIYLKNNDDPKFDKASLDDYVELFKNFKLKVVEAEHLGYDTLPSLKRELQGYDDQLAKPYLIDTSKTNHLIKEAYDRMKKEVHASHILISLPKNPSPDDTLKAYKKAMKVREQILKGEDFGVAAAKSSSDPSAKDNQGDLGYFTAFQMVYPFETGAYNLKDGEISMPIRSSYGYHIIKKTGERPARGTITAAHIMVAFSKNPTDAELKKAEAKINEVYEQLQKGKTFEKLASLYSDDQGSKNNGGKLPAFGTGTTQRMITPFEDAAFALKNDGAYSLPFKTQYGYHIVKRIDYKPLGTFDELKSEISQKIKTTDRSQISEQAFLRNLKKENKFKDKSAQNLTWFYDNIDSTVFKKDWEAPTLKSNKWLFKYKKNKYDMQAFLNYIKDKKFKIKMPIRTMVNEYYTAWQDESIMEDEKASLVDKYPTYKALLQEYHDGVLLYEIMQNKVWNKAIKDSTGLANYYEANLAQYQWPDRVEANIYSSDKKEMVLEAKLLSDIDTLNINDILNKVNADSQLNLSVVNGKYIQSENEVLANMKDLKEGGNEITKDGDTYHFVYVEKFLPAGPKALNEARGEIIQDYQKYLDTEWIKELNDKYTVKINKDVLYNLGK